MRRIFTLVLTSSILMCSQLALVAQTCFTGTPINTNNNFSFTGGAQGFSGFQHNNNQLESTPYAGTKQLITATFFQPATKNTIGWSYDLGTSNNQVVVSSYQVFARYLENGVYRETLICSGDVTVGNNLNFSATAPEVMKGKDFQFHFNFFVTNANVSGRITIDNFKTDASSHLIALPVKFAQFTAKQVSAGVLLNWTIDAEENTKGYEIERSADGRSYSPIAIVTATGYRSYSFTDTRPLADGYYRIRAYDNDGRFGFSNILRLKGGVSNIVVKAFLAGSNTLAVQHEPAARGTLISVFSAEGRLVKSVQALPGSQQTTIDIYGLPAGLMLVRYENVNGHNETIKIVKQ